ncbi:MAG TPA: glycosyl hydrolase [bacterium]|nr:glycosyl hydrolase [bacterium]HPR86737.1 glycosyl hydrolase [bacterium]
MHRLKFTAVMMLFVALSSACGKKESTNGPEKVTPVVTNTLLVDSLATAETVALFKNLRILAQTYLLFGHQEDLAYGVGWWAEYGRSDVKEVCGDYPAVYGWDIGDIQNEKNVDGVYFDAMKIWIKQAYERGGINTISMHLDNPVSGGNAWDNSPAVKYILPGQSHHAAYLQILDKIAAFLQDLKSFDGTAIPVILRPYHEHNHDWPWWGSSACTPAEYNALWQMTVRYLRDTKGVHHLLYCISPQEVSSESGYLARYPGDDWVDILGMDYYLLTDKSRVSHLGNALAVVATMAEARGKIAALTEVGIQNVPISDWWTQYLLAAVQYNAQAKKTAWALVWRNAGTSQYWAPYKGQVSAADFILFYQNPFTLFEKDLPAMYQ